MYFLVIKLTLYLRKHGYQGLVNEFVFLVQPKLNMPAEPKHHFTKVWVKPARIFHNAVFNSIRAFPFRISDCYVICQTYNA